MLLTLCAVTTFSSLYIVTFPMLYCLFNLPTVLHQFWSEEGLQRCDPMGPLSFCLALESLTSGLPLDGIDVNVWYLDDGSIAGRYNAVVAFSNTPKKKVRLFVFILMKGRLKLLF